MMPPVTGPQLRVTRSRRNIRRAVPVIGVDKDWTADEPVFDHFFDCYQEGIPPKDEADGAFHARPLDRHAHRIQFVRVEGHGFFDQDVFAVLGSEDTFLCVSIRRGTNRDDVEPRGA